MMRKDNARGTRRLTHLEMQTVMEIQMIKKSKPEIGESFIYKSILESHAFPGISFSLVLSLLYQSILEVHHKTMPAAHGG